MLARGIVVLSSARTLKRNSLAEEREEENGRGKNEKRRDNARPSVLTHVVIVGICKFQRSQTERV